MTKKALLTLLLATLFLWTGATVSYALQPRAYTEDAPLVIVCDWDFPPFEFLNEKNQPDGYNIDLLSIILQRMDIPFRFEMKDRNEANEAFKNRKADLIQALSSDYDGAPYIHTTTYINTYTTHETSQELHLVGYDRQLINQIDDEYARMMQAGQLDEINDKWFHPERIHDNTPPYVLFLTLAFFVVAIGFIALSHLIRVRVKKATLRAKDLSGMMRQALSMGDYYVFEHDVPNKRMTNVYGNLLPDEGLPFDTFMASIHPDDQPEARDIFNHLLKGERQTYDLNIRWEGKYLKGYTFAEFQDGRLVHTINTVKNITHDIETERADSEMASRYMRIFEINAIAMSYYGADGQLITINENMRKLSGFDKLGDTFFRKVKLWDMPLLKKDFDPKSHIPFKVCQHMVFPEVDIDKYIDFQIYPTFNDRNELKYYTVTAYDVTEERNIWLDMHRQEKELKQVGKTIARYEKELIYLLDNSDTFVWHYDIDTDEIFFSRSLKTNELRESFDEYLDSLYEDERQNAIESIKHLCKEPQAFSTIHHFRFTHNTEEPKWYAISGMPTFDEKGNMTGLFGVLRNIDDLMNAQEQLKKERRRAEASGMMKSAFLANMTHEIRTPLNAIVGFSDLLQLVDDPNDRQEFIRIIRNNSDMLLRLINDILEASDTGQTLAITPTDVDFAQVFDDICQTLEQRVQEPGVKFLKDNPYDTFPTRLDKGRVQQVITNFVTNAVKYTQQGYIKVGYRQENGGIYLYCEDTGAGIPKDKQASVFERFVKLNDFVQGTGLGLSICKTIADHCGGKIGVFSDGEGKGSTFWFWIPCDKKLKG